jgi:hypothetical protein
MPLAMESGPLPYYYWVQRAELAGGFIICVSSILTALARDRSARCHSVRQSSASHRLAPLISTLSPRCTGNSQMSSNLDTGSLSADTM